MSHFVTLVNFYMPKLEENCEENMRYAEQIAEVKEKLTQDPESFALRFLLKRLQSKASTLERSAECEIDELMAPFCEGTDDPAYLEFEDRTDDLRRDYETDKINCVRFPDGTVPFPVSWTVKMKKKQKETQDILSYHTQAAGCSDKARAKASGGRQPIEECGRTGL